MDMFGGAYVPSEAPEFRGNYARNLEAVKRWQASTVEEIIEPELPIVDAHHHLQEDKNGRYLFHDFMEDANSGHNVVSTVHVQGYSMHRADGPEVLKPVGETEFARGIAAMSASGLYGKVRLCDAIVGYVDFRFGETVGEALDAHIEAAGGRFRGIRQIAPRVTGELAKVMVLQQPEGLYRDETFRRGYAELGKRNLSFDAWVFHPQLGDVVDLARAFPNIPVIMNHLGGRLGIGEYAKRFGETFAEWRASLKALAAQPNAFMKLGGGGMLYSGFAFHTRERAPDSETLANAWSPFLDTAIEAFGPERCMLESNFPVDKQSCSYHVLWNALKRATKKYSPAERTALFRGTAERVYRLPKRA